MVISGNGSTIMEEIIDILVDELEDEQKERIYYKLIKLFDNEGCEDLMDIQSSDPIFDEILSAYYDSEEDDEDYSEEKEEII